MKRYGLSFALLLSLGLISPVHAKDYMPLDGQIAGEVDLYDQANKITGSQKVMFEKVKLTKEAKANIASRLTSNDTASSTLTDELPPQFDLGMHGLAPLNQGVHGTCVTFAISGALNAATLQNIPNPNYFMSELCSLELGNYLHSQNASYPSGWDGSWSTIVLRQVKTHGIVMMKYQRFPGCAGMTEYPANDINNKGKMMSDYDYRQLAQHPYPNMTWRSLFNLNNAISKKIIMNDVLANIKKSLVEGNGDGEGHRVLLAFLLDPSVGGAGSLGTFKKPNDSWIITPEIEEHARNGQLYAGHELIIFGYDDKAVITGPDGNKHVGVFTLRNSWGMAGDNGNYYMSYDYLQKLSLDVLELIP